MAAPSTGHAVVVRLPQGRFAIDVDYPPWSGIDAWPEYLTAPGCFVYRWYDDQDTLLYVGATKRAWHRTRQHRWSSPWFRFIEYGSIEQFERPDDQHAAELHAIITEKPVFNRERPGGRRHDSRRRAYLLGRQAWDELRHDMLGLPWHRFPDATRARDRGYL